MTTFQISELAGALSSSLGQSQEKVDQYLADRITRVIQMDKKGFPESLVWECRLPSGSGYEQTFEMVRLPWASLCPPQTVEITRVSITMDCKVTRKDEAQTLITPNSMVWPGVKKKIHTVKLSVARPEKNARITIDGQPFEVFQAKHLLKDPAPQEGYHSQKVNKRTGWILSVLVLFVALVVVFYFFL